MNKLQENEHLLLSTLLKSEESRRVILNKIKNPEHYFTVKECRSLFNTIKRLASSKHKIDLELINSHSSIDYKIIKDIYDNYGEIDTQNIESHLKILKANSLEFDLTNGIFKKIAETISESKKSVENKIDSLLDIFKEVELRKHEDISLLQDMNSLVNSYFDLLDKRKQGITFYPTGDFRLDKAMTYGYMPKEITVIAGRPSNGKSLFRLDNARKLANLKIPTAIYNMEMRNESDMDRLVAMSTQIDATRLVKCFNQVTELETKSIVSELNRMRSEMSLFMSDKTGLDLDSIKSSVGDLQDRLKTEYIVIYLDLATKLMEFGGAESPLDFEKICNKIQRLTSELGVHTVLLLQINRNADKDRLTNVQDVTKIYPRITNIKNSSAFEEVGDNIFLLCKPTNYLKQYEWGEYVPDYLRLEIAKQRQGATATSSNVILYKTNNNYLGLIVPEDNWDPLEINISDEELRRFQ